MSLKDQFLSWVLNRKQNEQNRQVRAVNLTKIKTAGILWKMEDQKVFKLLVNQLKKQGISVHALCFSEQRGSVQGEAIFSPADFSLFGKIKNPEIQQFIDNQSDILIDISLSSAIEMQYIRGLSKAAFKVGWSNAEPNFFDMTIDISSQKEPGYLVEQLLYYLAELNKQQVVNEIE